MMRSIGKMGKGAPLRWFENRILRKHLQGIGVEIGALWRRFPVRRNVRVWYVDRQSIAGLQEHYSEYRENLVRPDVIADAADFPFANGSLNFIIASHVLEHLPLPLAALRRWYNALAPDGILLLRIPDKRFTFDAPRTRTSLDHLVVEMEHPNTSESRQHYAEWVEHIYHAKPSEPHFEASVQNLIDSGFSIHYHVWTDQDVREMIDYTVTAWGLAWRPILFWHAHFYRKETIVLLQRQRVQTKSMRASA